MPVRDNSVLCTVCLRTFRMEGLPQLYPRGITASARKLVQFSVLYTRSGSGAGCSQVCCRLPWEAPQEIFYSVCERSFRRPGL